MIIAGIDIGNSTTQVVIVQKNETGFVFLSTDYVKTTGVKGTLENYKGCLETLDNALLKAGLSRDDIDTIRLNHAAPVIGDLSMDTISETKVIGSAMIGHNPDTPGGQGLGIGVLEKLENLTDTSKNYIVIIDNMRFDVAANLLNKAFDNGFIINGVIVQNDDAVLIANRISRVIPIIDEVLHTEKLEIGAKAAVEVALGGQNISTLSNPYGIASIFDLTPEETKDVIAVAKSLSGTKSGVVVRAKNSSVTSKKVKAGNIQLISDTLTTIIDVNEGASKIMKSLEYLGDLVDVSGEENTNVYNLITKIKKEMADLTLDSVENMKINDILAADTFKATKVFGGLAGEVAFENVVLLAAQVKTSKLAMESIAKAIKENVKANVYVFGYEAEMAIRGACTTKGASKPLAILDLGGGSTDAAIMDLDGKITSVHTAGAGEMVTKMIDLELNINDRDIAELIKKYPLAKVESLLFIRFEDGSVKFLKEPLPPNLFSRIVVVTDEGLVPLPRIKNLTISKVKYVRRKAKRSIFLTNAIRSLKKVAPFSEITNINSVVLVGGSAKDFEISEILSEYLSEKRITVGKANMLGFLSPHSAVALGLAISD